MAFLRKMFKRRRREELETTATSNLEDTGVNITRDSNITSKAKKKNMLSLIGRCFGRRGKNSSEDEANSELENPEAHHCSSVHSIKPESNDNFLANLIISPSTAPGETHLQSTTSSANLNISQSTASDELHTQLATSCPELFERSTTASFETIPNTVSAPSRICISDHHPESNVGPIHGRTSEPVITSSNKKTSAQCPVTFTKPVQTLSFISAKQLLQTPLTGLTRALAMTTIASNLAKLERRSDSVTSINEAAASSQCELPTDESLPTDNVLLGEILVHSEESKSIRHPSEMLIEQVQAENFSSTPPSASNPEIKEDEGIPHPSKTRHSMFHFRSFWKKFKNGKLSNDKRDSIKKPRDSVALHSSPAIRRPLGNPVAATHTQVIATTSPSTSNSAPKEDECLSYSSRTKNPIFNFKCCWKKCKGVKIVTGKRDSSKKSRKSFGIPVSLSTDAASTSSQDSLSVSSSASNAETKGDEGISCSSRDKHSNSNFKCCWKKRKRGEISYNKRDPQEIMDPALVHVPTPSPILVFGSEASLKERIRDINIPKQENSTSVQRIELLHHLWNKFKIREKFRENNKLYPEKTKENVELGYKHICVLGRGTHSIVTKVKDRTSERTFALKIMKISHSFDRVLNEIAIVKKLSGHPRFLRYYSYYENLHPKYTMEYGILMEAFDGQNLMRYRKKKSLRQIDVKTILHQLGIALKYIHSRGIIHCDVKPANILINDEMNVKLIGFGLACNGPISTIACGSAGFRAPQVKSFEEANTFPSYGYSADYYSVGAVLYTLLYGRHPPEKAAFSHVMTNYIRYAFNYSVLKRSRKYADVITKEDVRFMAKLLNDCPEARPNDETYLADKYFDSMRNDITRARIWKI